jgi:hypothetical protein
MFNNYLLDVYDEKTSSFFTVKWRRKALIISVDCWVETIDIYVFAIKWNWKVLIILLIAGLKP